MANIRITDKPKLEQFENVALLVTNTTNLNDYQTDGSGIAKISNSKSIYEVTCTTPADDEHKKVKIQGVNEIFSGLTLWVTFVEGNTAMNPMLTVNTLTEYPLEVQGQAPSALFIEPNKQYKLEFVNNGWSITNQGQSGVQLLDQTFGVATSLDNGTYDISNIKEIGRYTWTTKVPKGIDISGRTEEDNKYGSLTVTKVGSGNNRKQIINFSIDNSQFSRTNSNGSNLWDAFKKTAIDEDIYSNKTVKYAFRDSELEATYTQWIEWGESTNENLPWTLNNLGDFNVGDTALIRGKVIDKPGLEATIVVKVNKKTPTNIEGKSYHVSFTAIPTESGDSTLFIKPNSNEIDFGGSYDSSNTDMYIGRKPADIGDSKRPIPGTYIFGKGQTKERNGSAEIRAKNFILDGKQVITSEDAYLKNEIDDKNNAEIKARTDADASLDNKISTETNLRTDADLAIRNELKDGTLSAQEAVNSQQLGGVNAVNYALKTQLGDGKSVTTVSPTATKNGSEIATRNDTYTKQEVDNILSSVYKFKGSVPTYADLPKEGQQTGNVWDVVDTGINYAWTGSKWDELGGKLEVDLTGYARVTQLSDGVSVTKVSSTATKGGNEIATVENVRVEAEARATADKAELNARVAADSAEAETRALNDKAIRDELAAGTLVPKKAESAVGLIDNSGSYTPWAASYGGPGASSETAEWMCFWNPADHSIDAVAQNVLKVAYAGDADNATHAGDAGGLKESNTVWRPNFHPSNNKSPNWLTCWNENNHTLDACPRGEVYVGGAYNADKLGGVVANDYAKKIDLRPAEIEPGGVYIVNAPSVEEATAMLPNYGTWTYVKTI